MAARSMLNAASALLLAFVVGGCESLIGLEERKLVAADASSDEDASSNEMDASGPDSDGGDASDDGGGDDGGQDASDPGDAIVVHTLCDDYCETVMDACTGNYAVYPSLEVCLAVCQQLPEGEEGDREGNSVQCRYRAARQVTEQPADCPAAGPGGAGRCGDNCESYCGLMDAVCEEQRLPSVEECVDKCAALRDRDDLALDHDDSRYSAGAIRARDFDGDTVQCRLVHVSLAAGPLGADAQCWAAALAPRPDPDGGDNPCLQDINQEAVRCEDYCKLNMVACQGMQAVYESTDQCLAACEAMPPGEMTDSGGQDTLGCRSTHSYNALVGDPMTHCPHAGPTGSAVCGMDCPAYCTQLKSACPAAFELQHGAGDGGLATCVTECGPLLDGAASLAYAVGDEQIMSLPPLACQMRAAARAHVASDNADLCEQALGLATCE